MSFGLHRAMVALMEIRVAPLAPIRDTREGLHLQALDSLLLPHVPC